MFEPPPSHLPGWTALPPPPPPPRSRADVVAAAVLGPVAIWCMGLAVLLFVPSSELPGDDCTTGEIGCQASEAEISLGLGLVIGVLAVPLAILVGVLVGRAGAEASRWRRLGLVLAGFAVVTVAVVAHLLVRIPNRAAG